MITCIVFLWFITNSGTCLWLVGEGSLQLEEITIRQKWNPWRMWLQQLRMRCFRTLWWWLGQASVPPAASQTSGRATHSLCFLVCLVFTVAFLKQTLSWVHLQAIVLRWLPRPVNLSFSIMFCYIYGFNFTQKMIREKYCIYAFLYHISVAFSQLCYY